VASRLTDQPVLRLKGPPGTRRWRNPRSAKAESGAAITYISCLSLRRVTTRPHQRPVAYESAVDCGFTANGHVQLANCSASRGRISMFQAWERGRLFYTCPRVEGCRTLVQEIGGRDAICASRLRALHIPSAADAIYATRPRTAMHPHRFRSDHMRPFMYRTFASRTASEYLTRSRGWVTDLVSSCRAGRYTYHHRQYES
jgi:hypothetical protein